MRQLRTTSRVGPALLAIAVIHLVSTPMFHSDGVRAVLDHGPFNGVESGTELLDARAAAFWYVTAGLLLVPFGYLCWMFEARGHRVPAGVGWLLLAFTLITGLLVPLGGFWLFLVPAALVLWSHWRARDAADVRPGTAHDAARATSR